MGRGRAKAKQTKVARDLKYSTPNTDLSRLQAELSSQPVGPRTVTVQDDDPYADLADRYATDDDDDDDGEAVAATR